MVALIPLCLLLLATPGLLLRVSSIAAAMQQQMLLRIEASFGSQLRETIGQLLNTLKRESIVVRVRAGEGRGARDDSGKTHIVCHGTERRHSAVRSARAGFRDSVAQPAARQTVTAKPDRMAAHGADVVDHRCNHIRSVTEVSCRLLWQQPQRLWRCRRNPGSNGLDEYRQPGAVLWGRALQGQGNRERGSAMIAVVRDPEIET
jgi:hypothetical protein